MSVNTLPNISKFMFHYSPIFNLIFIMLLYILKAYDFRIWGGSFFIMIALFSIPFMIYLIVTTRYEPDFNTPYSLFKKIPYASTFILLFCITSYSMTMGMMSVINNRIKASNNNNNNNNNDNDNDNKCVYKPNAMILILFILLLINDVYRYNKLNIKIQPLSYIALFSLSILPALATYFIIGITANENNNNSNLLFIQTYSNRVCSNNQFGREFYCRDIDDGTVVAR